MSRHRRHQDSRLISEMKQQLQRLQERRQELESRQVEEEEALRQPIVPHLARVMRDRQWAQVRSMVQRNMDAIDQDIQEAIGRLGAAMLETTDDDPISSPTAGRSPRRHFPDLIPKPIKSHRTTVPTEPLSRPSSLSIQSNSGSKQLPQPGSPSRRTLLEAVKDTLERRTKSQPAIKDNQEEDDVSSLPSPRVGFYQFSHESGQDKLSRLSVQKLPSVSIATQRVDRPLNHVISVQSPSIVADRVPVDSPPSVSQNEPVLPVDNGLVVNNRFDNVDIQPDDVARLVSDILASQLQLAVDSFDCFQQETKKREPGTVTSSRQCQRDNDYDVVVDDDDDLVDEFRLTIDSCTQTAIRTVKDSSTSMMTNERCYQTDRGVGSDLAISLESDPEEIMQDVYYEDDDIDDQEKRRIAEEEMEEEEPLTPPRASNINIAPDPTPPLDLNLWRRLYPPTPPSSSCSESLISLAAGIFHESSSTSTSTTTDATGISSSLATISSTSSSSTVDKDSLVSWLSQGQVPNRVASPGQVTVHQPTPIPFAISSSPAGTDCDAKQMNRSIEDLTFSEGQVLLIDIQNRTTAIEKLTTTLTDGSSEGEILLAPASSRSDSTASFRSATGSLGEIPAD